MNCASPPRSSASPSTTTSSSAAPATRASGAWGCCKRPSPLPPIVMLGLDPSIQDTRTSHALDLRLEAKGDDRRSGSRVADTHPRRYNRAFPALLRLSGNSRMIPRYSRPEMTAIWEPENRFRIWFEIEAHACDAQAELGVIPKEAAKAVWERGAFEVERIDEIERETRHDVIAFLTNLTEHVGPEARFVHQGMTSSDVLDTCLAVQLTQATDILLADMDRVLAALKQRALEHKHSVCVGRSHGIHAEPTTFGVKLAGHYAAFARGRARLEAARKEIATCAISGAVGTFANIDPFVEDYVAKKLGLAPEPVPPQRAGVRRGGKAGRRTCRSRGSP